MKALLYREIKSFFGSAIGYLVVAVFLLLNGLFLWVFDGDYNVLNSGYNDLSPFFKLAPWVLLLLIPAVTMRSFSDERKQGTIELLLTKPLSITEIVLGKFFGSFALIIIALLPTILYVFVLNAYGFPVGNIDLGSVIGSYFGLVFLVFAYTAIGVFSSAITENQIVAFILSVVFCFVFYKGFDELSQLSSLSVLEKLGMNYHFKSMSRGVIDTRDVLYFISVSVLFIGLTIGKIKTLRK